MSVDTSIRQRLTGENYKQRQREMLDALDQPFIQENFYYLRRSLRFLCPTCQQIYDTSAHTRLLIHLKSKKHNDSEARNKQELEKENLLRFQQFYNSNVNSKLSSNKHDQLPNKFDMRQIITEALEEFGKAQTIKQNHLSQQDILKSQNLANQSEPIVKDKKNIETKWDSFDINILIHALYTSKSTRKNTTSAVNKFLYYLRANSVRYYNNTQQACDYFDSIVDASSKTQMKALISRIKRFTVYAMRQNYNMTFNESHFLLTAEVKSKAKTIKPHSYWNREIIWLMMLYYYEQYVISDNFKYLKMIIAIEIAYQRALRIGDLQLFTYDQLIRGKQHMTQKSKKEVSLKFTKQYCNDLNARLVQAGICINNPVITQTTSSLISNQFSKGDGKNWKTKVLPFIINLLKKGNNNELLNLSYKDRHFKTHDLRKSRLLDLYSSGYSKSAIAEFATHSSEQTTFSYYVNDHGYNLANSRRYNFMTINGQRELCAIPNELEADLPYFNQYGKLVYPKQKLKTIIFNSQYQAIVDNIEKLIASKASTSQVRAKSTAKTAIKLTAAKKAPVPVRKSLRAKS